MPEQDNIFSPVDILNITKEHLKTVPSVVVLEGEYLQVGTKDYRGVWYDALKSMYSHHKLTIIIPTQLRSILSPGDIVRLSGTVEKTLSDEGMVKLSFRVSDYHGKREKELTENEKNIIRLQSIKSEQGYRNVDAILSNLLYQGQRRPKVALLYAESSITNHDFQSGVQSAGSSIDFTQETTSFAQIPSFISKLQSIDSMGYDILCIVRGGGSGIEEVFNNADLATAIIELKTPTISAIGHQVDNPLVCKVTDKNIGTPSLLGQYFKDTVEKITSERTSSKAVLVEQVKQQFTAQINTLNKQNQDLQKQMTDQRQQSQTILEQMQKKDDERSRLFGQISSLKSQVKAMKIKNTLLVVAIVVLIGLLLWTLMK